MAQKKLSVSAEQLVNVINAGLDQLIGEFASKVAAGGAETFDVYKSTTGRIKGLQDAKVVIQNALARVNAPDADPDGKGLSEMQTGPIQ
jgi:hypothetical protein